jgi:hypothetical protein
MHEHAGDDVRLPDTEHRREPATRRHSGNEYPLGVDQVFVPH